MFNIKQERLEDDDEDETQVENNQDQTTLNINIKQESVQTISKMAFAGLRGKCNF